ncbi:MAG: tellurite resistance/C4-dicarboxylate transporter family protein [Armatimonadetes bacterium]|nr:tellurite resistance/C4-dicarboxylate transporter family protein [Armatimonadota bacterium]
MVASTFEINQLELRAAPPEAVAAGVVARLMRRIGRANRGMYPGYFALVMATGIVSNAFFLLGYQCISQLLLWVNLVAYPTLIAATVMRLARFRAELWADLTNPEWVFTFFTFVAGSNVLGVQLFLRGYQSPALALWLIALVVWLILGYFSFSVLTFARPRPGIEVVHGGWLIAIVATQSIVLLGTLLAPGMESLTTVAFLGVHSLWGVGVALYGIFIIFIVYRLFFVRLDPADLTPVYWVIMGAAAISANAGAAIIRSAPSVPFLTALRPFVEGATLSLWAWSTWWIPLLVVFGVWRHLVCRVPLTYHPAYWSMVFPLGMYAVATYRLSLAAELEGLKVIPQVMAWVALSAWGVTMLGLLRLLARSGVQCLQVSEGL